MSGGRATILSPCRTFRYVLWREWIGGNGYLLSLGLNPSRADELVNDPTICREIDFAKRWGFGALCKWNLFGFRAPEPDDMKAAVDPIGPDNDRYLLELASGAGLILAAWGADGAHLDRANHVMALLRGFDVHCLKLTKAGQPGHPLYLRADTAPQLWRARAA